MKSFRVISLLCAAACAVAASVVESAVAVYRFVKTCASDGLDAVLVKFKKPSHALPKPAVALVQARAFVMRLAKRDRPRVTPSWRLCSSV